MKTKHETLDLETLDTICGGKGLAQAGWDFARDVGNSVATNYATGGVKGVITGAGESLYDTGAKFAEGFSQGAHGDMSSWNGAGHDFTQGVKDSAQEISTAYANYGNLAPGLAAAAPVAAAFVPGAVELAPAAIGAELVAGGVANTLSADRVGSAVGAAFAPVVQGAEAAYGLASDAYHAASDWWNGSGNAAHDDHAVGSADTSGLGGGDGFGHNGAGDPGSYMMDNQQHAGGDDAFNPGGGDFGGGGASGDFSGADGHYDGGGFSDDAFGHADGTYDAASFTEDGFGHGDLSSGVGDGFQDQPGNGDFDASSPAIADGHYDGGGFSDDSFSNADVQGGYSDAGGGYDGGGSDFGGGDFGGGSDFA